MDVAGKDDIDVGSDITITRSVEGRIIVRHSGVLVLTGVAEGGVVVCGGGFARISGRTHGLMVAAGGHAVLTGTCEGSAINDGGDLQVSGMVHGALLDQAGTTVIEPGAVIVDGHRVIRT